MQIPLGVGTYCGLDPNNKEEIMVKLGKPGLGYLGGLGLFIYGFVFVWRRTHRIKILFLSASPKDLQDDDERINPYGGAIAIGHPIGSSGVQYFANMAHYLVNKKKKFGIQTLCGGGGVGIATVVERIP